MLLAHKGKKMGVEQIRIDRAKRGMLLVRKGKKMGAEKNKKIGIFRKVSGRINYG